MNKNKNIIIEFLNQFYINKKYITLNNDNININFNEKNYKKILLFKIIKDNNNCKIIYLNDFNDDDKYYKKYYDISIETVSEYIYYIKNYLDINCQNILFNNFIFNDININILIGAGMYLLHTIYYKEITENNEKYYFFFINKS